MVRSDWGLEVAAGVASDASDIEDGVKPSADRSAYWKGGVAEAAAEADEAGAEVAAGVVSVPLTLFLKSEMMSPRME